MTRSSVIQTTCFATIHEATRELEKDSLVIFDIDDVLITARDHVLRNPHKEDWLNTYFNNKFSPEEVLHISGYAWTSYATEITDPKVASLNEDLKTRGIPSIALTAGWNGSLGTSPSHCDDRVDILQNIGLDFSCSFESLPETFFHGLENCGRIPSFKKGVIFACMLPKSSVLEAFLTVSKYVPKEIIFVDDMRYNIDDMEAYCANNGIHYQGFHYTGVEARDNKPFEADIAHLQFQTVIKDKVWLSDDEARKQLSEKKFKMA